jgi:sec-independent protein translocase protein TatC
MTHDEATMSLLEHLEELRSRLIKIVISVVVGAIVGFILARPVLIILRAPLPDEFEQLTFLGPADPFSAQLKVAVFLGIAFAMPVILFHLWRFVTPGLTSGERRFIWPAVLVAMLLFVLGMGVGYLVLPYALTFLLSFAEGLADPSLTIDRYIGFVTTMLLAFGLVFEFPVVLIGLSRVGILSYRRLAAQRRWALLIIVLLAVILTPGGDIISPLIMSGLMYVLFEGSLLVIRFSRRG